jgi:hypothetical protein
MAQAVSCWSFTADARVRACVSPCGICGGQSGAGTSFSQSFYFLLSISFHRGFCTYIYHLGMNNRLVGGRSSETASPHRHEQQQQQRQEP